jgi:hypothetical protein
MKLSFFKTSYNSVAHFVARQLGTLAKFDKFFGAHEAQIESGLDKVATVGAGVAVAAGHPELAAVIAAVDAAGKALIGKSFEVVKDLDEAAAAKGASLPLDAAAIAGLKELFSKIETIAPGLTTAPAGLPLETKTA